jgi:hypothetical protein
MEHCRAYLAGRRATYEMREARFRLVHDRMEELGLTDNDVVFDLGAGHCQFDYFLRHQHWQGVYVPVDGSIDGTDLNLWTPKMQPDFFVLSEVLEHLEIPYNLLRRLAPRKGIVLTTPNPAVVDVLACDEDHKRVIEPKVLVEMGFTVEAYQCFGKEQDTLVAWKGGTR